MSQADETRAALYLALIALHLGQLAWYGPRLPARVASHFNAAGVADGWSGRQELLLVLAAGEEALRKKGAGKKVLTTE